MQARTDVCEMSEMMEWTELAQRTSGLEQQQDPGTRPEVHSEGCRKHWEPNCVKAGFILTVMPQNHAPCAEPMVAPSGASRYD